MRVIKATYQDSKGNIWEVERISLPKKKGAYTFYYAECEKLNLSFRENLKREVIKKIKNLSNVTLA